MSFREPHELYNAFPQPHEWPEERVSGYDRLFEQCQSSNNLLGRENAAAWVLGVGTLLGGLLAAWVAKVDADCLKLDERNVKVNELTLALAIYKALEEYNIRQQTDLSAPAGMRSTQTLPLPPDLLQFLQEASGALTAPSAHAQPTGVTP